MKRLNFQQMEALNDGNEIDCALAMLVFAGSLAGFITTAGVGFAVWFGMGGLLVSSMSFIRSC